MLSRAKLDLLGIRCSFLDYLRSQAALIAIEYASGPARRLGLERSKTGTGTKSFDGFRHSPAPDTRQWDGTADHMNRS
jgi:hypothetical protein